MQITRNINGKEIDITQEVLGRFKKGPDLEAENKAQKARIKELERAINDYKVEITYYRNIITPAI